MPPRATWFRVQEAVRCSSTARRSRPGGGGGSSRRAPAPSRRSGPICGTAERWEAHAIDVITLSPDGRIAEVTAFIDAAAFSRFGLPDELPA